MNANELLRDRLTTVEADVRNINARFNEHREEMADKIDQILDQQAVNRREVQATLKELGDDIGEINVTIGKWLGIGSVLMFLAQFVVPYFMKTT